MYFPVQASRVQVQYPVMRITESQFREVESPGGRRWRTTVEGPAIRRWILQFEDLTDVEAAALEALFESTAGGWRTFVFVDPVGNLLQWSEDLEAAVWGKDASVTVSRSDGATGQPAEFRIINGGAAAAMIWQELDLPPGLVLCLACEVLGEAIVLHAPGAAKKAVGGSGDWKRAFVTGESAGGVQRVGIEIPAGATAHIRRLQAEAQLSPSEYQGTFETGGIYAKTRFAESGFQLESVAPDRHRAEVILESVMENSW